MEFSRSGKIYELCPFMTHLADFQLELDFDCQVKPSDQVQVLPISSSLPAQIVCFESHRSLRHAREEAAKNAKLLEMISSRVRHFK